MDKLPRLIEPDQLYGVLNDESIVVIDLRKAETYLPAHIPGARNLAPLSLINGAPPAPGKLPGGEQLAQAFSAIGLTPDHRVVAYDGEGGGWACRLLWTLDVIGHAPGSLLNGGIDAWMGQGLATTDEVPEIAASNYPVSDIVACLASKDEILARLGDPALALLDARTPEEYNGVKMRAAKAGHIPGAVNLNWLDTMDKEQHHRLLPAPVLRELLLQRNISKDQEVIVYCHTHHRSAHSYFMLKHLGYINVKGYAGSWSEWGNDPDTPVES